VYRGDVGDVKRARARTTGDLGLYGFDDGALGFWEAAAGSRSL